MEVKSQNTKIWNNAEHLRKDSKMSVFATEFIPNNGLTTPSLNDMSFLMSFTLKSIRLTLDFFDVQGTLSGRAWTSSSCTTLGCRHALGSRGLDKTAYATSRDQIQQNAFSPRFPDLLKFHQSPGGLSSNMFLLCVRNRLWVYEVQCLQ